MRYQLFWFVERVEQCADQVTSSSDANGARALYHPDGVVNLSPEGLDERR